MAAGDDVSEFLSQNREKAAWVETLRGECESDKLWRYRQEFILRNMSEVCGDGEAPLPDTNPRGLDRLLAYSMVWVNHIFTGCRYPPNVMEKVVNMAEDIKVTDAPVHTMRDELVSKVKKRGISSSNEGVEEPCKKQKSSENNTKKAEAQSQPDHVMEKSSGKDSDASGPSTSLSQKEVFSTATQSTDANSGHYETSSRSSVSAPQAKSASGLDPTTDAKPESAAQERKTPVKGSSQCSVSSVKAPRRLTAEDTKERQIFFNRLYKTVAWKLVSAGGFSLSLNHAELLNTCIESLKSTLDITFIPLKELADLPQNKTSQENIVCELRCKAVYLGMGCGKTKENAKAVASREALKLFLKKRVVVRICRRKYSGREVEDLVLLDEEARSVNLPPALKNPQELI
ncbi:CDKN2A-interacting protein isoform X1 [Ascaphus truei]|uniref:CDKN2A-interacting protein isoform X1 n=1 Tax=Ascaphus truei TaxID=8439 RepID=UPI003F5A4FA2